MSRQKAVKHIEDIRKEVVEILSTTSSEVLIARVWEVVTGNSAGSKVNKQNKSGYINVTLFNKDK